MGKVIVSLVVIAFSAILIYFAYSLLEALVIDIIKLLRGKKNSSCCGGGSWIEEYRRRNGI